MIALARKELGDSAPVWAAGLALLVLWAVILVFDDLGDARPWALIAAGQGDILENLALFAFAVGHWIAAADARDGSLAFLDGLPVRRSTVFAVKAAMGFAPVLFVLAGWAMGLGALLWLADTPYVGPTLVPWAAIVASAAMTAAGWYGLGLGLSWLAELGWGVLVVGLFGMAVLMAGFPAIESWIPIGDHYPDVEFVDGLPDVDLHPGVFWLLLGSAATLASAARFVSWDATRRLDLGCALRALLYGLGGLGLAFLVLAASLGAVGAKWSRLLVDSAQVRVGELHFLYDRAREADAIGLIAASPGIDRRVRGLFGLTAPVRLDIELLGSAAFHAGRFHGGKIRLSESAGPEVLAHELAHAYSYALAGPALGERHAYAGFFVEGVADWAEDRVFPDLGGADTSWRLAALIHATDQSAFDDLVSGDRRAARHDLAQVYPLGHTLVAVLVEIEGEDAPACLLRAVRDTADEDLRGLGLWYRLFDVCDADLDAVIGAWRAGLGARAEELPPLPELGARIVESARGPELIVEDRAGAGLDLLCRFRSDADDPIEEMRQTPVYMGRCRVPEERVRGRTVAYQLGFEVPDAGIVFEEWTTTELPR